MSDNEATGTNAHPASDESCDGDLPDRFLIQLINQPCNDVVAGDAFGLGVERRENSMSQHGFGHCHHIFQSSHVTSRQRRAGFGAEDQILNGSRTSAPGDKWLDPIRSFFRLRSSSSDQVDSELINVLRYGDSSNQLLKSLHGGSVEHVLQLRDRAAGRRASNLQLFRARWIVDRDQEHEAV